MLRTISCDLKSFGDRERESDGATMNWVGGVRNRIKLKQQKRQQKEFFEKRKLKSKFKLLGPPLSPQQNSSVSWDLLTLHIVNRIAAKKEHTDMPNKIIQVDMKKDTKMPIKQHNIELPMSPCSTPSRIFLDESQCRYFIFVLKDNPNKFASLHYGACPDLVCSQGQEGVTMSETGMEIQKVVMNERQPLHLSNRFEVLAACVDENKDCREDEQTDHSTVQHFLIEDGMTPLTAPIEHATVLTEHENIMPSCRSLPKHSNARLLQNSLMESSGLHSNNDEEYVSFAVQDSFPLSQKVTTQLATASQSMTCFGRDFPLTQCFNSESSQPVCQEKFMYNPLAPAETSFKMNTPCKRSDMCRISVVDQKSVIQNKKKENIFTQPKNNLFKEAVEKDYFGENNSHDQFLESNFEFNVQEKNGFFRRFEETWRPLDYRGPVLNDSIEGSQSPSYSPKETESCCSPFSDMSELDGQSMQPDVSAINKDSVQERLFDVRTVRENFEVQNVPSEEYTRETNSTSQSSPYPISKKVATDSIESNLVNSEQKGKPNQFVPSSMNCSSETCTYDQNTTDSKSFRGQDAWTQTECSLIHVKRSEIAIQCNLSNPTENFSSPVKEPTSVNDDGSNFEHTTRGQYNSSNKYSLCLDISSKKPIVLIEKDLSLGNRIHFEELGDTKCLKASREVHHLSGVRNTIDQKDLAGNLTRIYNTISREKINFVFHICSLLYWDVVVELGWCFTFPELSMQHNFVVPLMAQ
ncbi:regulator of DNA class I crossover intermediates 1-like [Heterodontus francisci]|uniref:regulator of DNA class I crossover intermediates 1-like n=1 Tax=Heterodontus francisci TaxID=7792 RepID=UPI00355C0168